MVSKLISHCSASVLKTGIRLRIFPATLDPKTGMILLKQGRRLSVPGFPQIGFQLSTHQWTPRLYLLLQILNGLYYIFFFFCCEYSLLDVLIASVLGATMSAMTFLAQLNYYFNFPKFVALINSVRRLELKFCEAGISNSNSDACDHVIRGLLMVCVVETLAVFPLALHIFSSEDIYIYKHVLMLAEILVALPRQVWIFVLSLLATYLAAVCSPIVAHVVLHMISYVNSQSRWMKAITQHWTTASERHKEWAQETKGRAAVPDCVLGSRLEHGRLQSRPACFRSRRRACHRGSSVLLNQAELQPSP